MFEEYFREQLELAADLLTEDTRDLLRELDINASGDLIDSTRWVVTDDNDLQIVFNDYGLYVDAGQRGSNGSVNSPFTVHPPSFSRRQRGNVGTLTPISRSSFTEDGGSVVLTYSDVRRWISDRGITPYRGDRDGLAFAIQNSILEKGVQPTNWIEDAIDNEIVADIIGEAHSIATEMTLNETFNIT